MKLGIVVCLLLLFGWVGTGCQLDQTGVEPSVKEMDQPESSGQKLYEQYCAMCHASSGVGTAMVPDHVKFTDAAWHSHHTDEQIAETIRNGSGTMPAFGEKLTDEEIQEIVSYIRGLAKPN